MVAFLGAPASADTLLAAQIATQLAETNRANLRRLSVAVRGGEVTLRGCVASFYERQIAIQTCRVLTGIVRVNDAVEVSPTGQ
jgi:osmotically-inducible protein OsmY